MSTYSGGDMIVNLTSLPEAPRLEEGIRIKRAFLGDKETILKFVDDNFDSNWRPEVEKSLMLQPTACFIATENGRLLGFACYDVSALGFFGPTGVMESERGRHIGAALLIRTLTAMADAGYGYAIIGWVYGAAGFYGKFVNASFIPGGEPENSVYSNMISMK